MKRRRRYRVTQADIVLALAALLMLVAVILFMVLQPYEPFNRWENIWQ